MTYKLEFITADGQKYKFDAHPNKLEWNLSGLGLPPHEIQTTQHPYQQGLTPLSYKLNPRNVTLTLRHNGCTWDIYRANRLSFAEAFRLNRSDPLVPGTLWYTYLVNGVKTVRCVDCVLNLGDALFTSLPGWQLYTFQEALTFTCYDPIIYDPTLYTTSVTAFTATLILPITFPFTLGCVTGTGTITYTGTWATPLQIVITGPAYYVTIIHAETGRRINLNYGISAGEIVTIDCKEIAVTNNFGEDLFPYVVESDIINFAVEADPLVASNTYTIYLIGNTADTKVELKYYRRYAGI